MSDVETRGRPTLKTAERTAKIMNLARAGKTNAQIAEIIGISERTLYEWKATDWEFSSELKEHQDFANQLVEMSVFKRAVGYSHPETKVFCHEGEIIEHEVTKHYPPDPVSATFWLTNRTEDWKVRKEEEHKILMIKQEIISSLPTEDVVLETEKLLAQVKNERSQD